MKFWMIRHPETVANQNHLIYGRLDYPYTMKGIQQKEAVAQWVRHAKESFAKEWSFEIISSPRERAKHLAEYIGSILSTSVVTDERITEMNFGCLEGLTVEEAKEAYPQVYEAFIHDFDSMHIPEGETYQAFVDRLNEFYAEQVAHRTKNNRVERLEQEKKREQGPKEKCLVVVTHGAVMRHYIETMLQLNPGDSWKFSVSNGTIVQYRWKQHWSVEAIIPCQMMEEKE